MYQKFGAYLFVFSLFYVSLLSAQSIDTHSRRLSTGVVMSDREVTLASKIMGRIEAIGFSEGEGVKQGDLLVELDDAELRADLASSIASVELARAEVKHHNKQVARLRQLRKKRSVSEDALDNAVFAAEAAVAKLKIAQAAVSKVQALLKETKIQAPFDAMITDKKVEIGTVTQPGTPLLELEDNKHLKFRTQVKEQDLPHIRMGQRVLVTIDALDDLQLEAKIS